MDKKLESIQARFEEATTSEYPPLHLWQPLLSGDIDIAIHRDGTWYHEGDEIKRKTLVNLFASILRREPDGDYYLVTPVEKWRIRVDLHPLLVTDVAWHKDSNPKVLQATLNTGRTIAIGQSHPLFLEPRVGDVAAIELPYGLAALFSRSAWYRLVDMAQEHRGVPSIVSDGPIFPLAREKGEEYQ